jgi:hypothetical protein
VELLRYANRAEVEASVWDEHRRLVTRVKREAEGLAGNVRLSDLLDLFEEQVMPGLSAGGRKSYRDSFAPLKAFFVAMKDDPPLERIRPGPIREYLAWRRTHRVRVESNGDVTAITGSVSPHTVARDYRTLKRLFRYAVKTEYLESDPVAKVEAPRTDPRTPHILTTDEYDGSSLHAGTARCSGSTSSCWARREAARTRRRCTFVGRTWIWPAGSCRSGAAATVTARRAARADGCR